MVAKTVDNLQVQLGADLGGIDKALRTWERQTLTSAQKAAASFKSFDDAVGRVEKKFLSLKNLAIAGVVTGIGAFITRTLGAVGALQDAADAAGLNVERYQELQKASQLSGVSVEAFASAMSRLAKTVGDAAEGNDEAIDKFKKLGVGILDSEGKLRSQDAILNDVIKSISSYGTQAERAAASAALFGRDAGPKFAAFVGQGEEAIAALVKEARALGLVLDEAMVRQADAASDKLEVLWDVIKTKLTVALVQLSPIIDKVATAIVFLAEALGGSVLDLNSRSSISAELEKVNAEIKRLKDQLDDPIASTLNDWMGFDTVKNLQAAQKKRAELMEAFFKAGRPAEDTGPTHNPLGKSASGTAAKSAAQAAARAEKFWKQFGEDWEKASKRQELAALKRPMEALADFERRKHEAFENYQRAADDMSADRAERLRGILDDFAEENRQHAEDVRATWGDALRGIGDTMISTLTDSSLTAWDKAKRIAFDAIEQIMKAAAFQLSGGKDPYKEAGGWIADALGGLFGNPGVGSAGGFFGAFGKLPMLAEGGPLRAGQMALVGEKGPELIVPSANSNVIPNHALGGAPAINQSFVFNVGTGASEAAALMHGLLPVIQKRAEAGVTDGLRRNRDVRKNI